MWSWSCDYSGDWFSCPQVSLKHMYSTYPILSFYLFPRAAVRDYYKPGGAEQQGFIPPGSGGQKSKTVSLGRHQGASGEVLPLEAQGRIAPSEHQDPWLVATSLHSASKVTLPLALLCVQSPSVSKISTLIPMCVFIPHCQAPLCHQGVL